MAVIIESSYGKTIGLPGYSSHKFSLSLQSEVGDLSQVAAEAERVYGILQSAVDTQMAQPGWVPNGNGESHAKPSYSAGSKDAASQTSTAGGTSTSNGANTGSPALPWCCSPKQRLLIEDLAQSNNVETAKFDDLARKRFGKALAQLNRLEASGLIDELLDTYRERKPAGGRRPAQRQYAGHGNGRGT
jgi:hypothetical protein